MKKSALSMKQSYIVCAVGIAVLFGLLMAICESGAANTYIKGILMTCCIAVIMTTSLNLTVGVLGQLTLGCCGFEMIGAYSAALLSKLIVAKGIAMDPTARFLLTIFVGAVIACIFGILVGIPALRLHGDYLAIITLGGEHLADALAAGRAVVPGEPLAATGELLLIDAVKVSLAAAMGKRLTFLTPAMGDSLRGALALAHHLASGGELPHRPPFVYTAGQASITA